MTETASPWPLAAATGPWRIPGSDAREAQRTVLGEFAELPTLVELPDRGVGADAVGRTAARLAAVSADLSIETTPAGWRLADAPGRDVRRALAWLGADLDDLEELAFGWDGPLVVGLVGPWTLTARIELPNGERLISDTGAARDLAGAFIEVARAFLADVVHRLPATRPLLRLDEPELAAALSGRLPTQSGWGRVRTLPEQDAKDAYAAIAAAVGDFGGSLALRAPGVAPAFAAGAGIGTVWHDTAEPADRDEFGAWFDAGGATVFEVDAPGGPDRIGAMVGNLDRLASGVGLDLERLMQRSALAPQVGQLRGRGLAEVAGRIAELSRAIRTEVAQRE